MHNPLYIDFKFAHHLLTGTAEHGEAVKRQALAILIILMHILAIALLFTLRELDDNRLTSWQWLLDGQTAFMLCLSLAGVLIFSWHIKLDLTHLNAPIGLFFAAFITGMLMLSEPEVIVDSARYFSQAKYLAHYGVMQFVREWGYAVSGWTDLPMVPLLYGLLFKLLGESRLVIQFANITMFAATVVMTWHIGRTLWDEKTGVYGGVLLLGMPYLLTQVPLMLVDVPSMFFLTLAICLTLQVINSKGLHWVMLAAIGITMALLAKYSNWLMLSVLPVLLLTGHSQDLRQTIRRLLWVAYGTALLITPFIVLKIDFITEQLHLLSSYQLPGLRRWQESPLSTFLFQIHPFISLAALVSIYFAIRQRDRHYLPVIWMWLIILMLGVNRSRYIIIALPMLALLAAYSIRRIHDKEIRHYLLLSIVMSSLLLTVGVYRPFLQSTSADNLQTAGRYLDQLDVVAVEVIALPQIDTSMNPLVSIPMLDLFTRQPLLYQVVENHKPPLDKQALSISPLRFSWELKLPDFYRDDGRYGKRAIAVIAGHTQQALPQDIQLRLKDYRVAARFTRQEGVFRYRTDVTVYEFSPAPQQDTHIQSHKG